MTTPIVVAADGVTIDGNGATLQGPGQPGDPRSHTGSGIRIEGRKNVTIKNLKVRGWREGVLAADSSDLTIDGCDLSDNYTDPEHGWGDGRPVGGMILRRVRGATVTDTKAERNWNGMALFECDRVSVTGCDFSHCSNTALRLWTTTNSTFTGNDFSYGIRISPGEVHARDSTGVLLESGSDNNRFERNDVTHGGDGVFIRVLNSWVSTGNVFVENDCSFANNNGFEAWSPGNRYLRNRANNCSHGFWLGGSDDTVLIGNEASWNGRADAPGGGHANAPELDFGHGGIVIVGGTGSRTVIDGNVCEHNNGAGIVFRGDLGSEGRKWKMEHMIVQNNRLAHNKTGLFARFTDWLDLSGNVLEGNQKDEFLEGVTNVTRRPAAPAGAAAPTAVLKGPERAVAGEPLVFDASESHDAGGGPVEFRWEIDGELFDTPTVRTAFDKPGYRRIDVLVTNGRTSALAFRDLYVAERTEHDATASAGDASEWSDRSTGSRGDQKVNIATDRETFLVGDSAVRVRPEPYSGGEVSVGFPKAGSGPIDLSGKKHLSFWLKWRNPNNGGFQGPTPTVRLHSGKASYAYVPAYNGLPKSGLFDIPFNEARYGWLRMEVPLEPPADSTAGDWLRFETFDGEKPAFVTNGLEFTTVSTPIETQDSCAMTSDGESLYLAAVNGDRLARSPDGKAWEDLPRGARTLRSPGPDYINGGLAFAPSLGEKGSLLLRYRDTERSDDGNNPGRLAAFDLATQKWSFLPTLPGLGHGVTVVGNHLYGLAHAVGGNYGGPVCRVDLTNPGRTDERTVLAPVVGKDAWWFSRAAQLAHVGGQNGKAVYAIKNDWQTPQPTKPEEVGDRLLRFKTADFKPSTFKGGKLWDATQWSEARTPTEDLGALPFEIGHGAALVALPANWSRDVGAEGGLFIVGGCSPSNHEGYGPPSNRFAVYDIASKDFTVGTLPEVTGTGTCATLHGGRVYIKRGGVNHPPSNAELWVVRPLGADEAARATTAAERQRIDMSKIDAVTFSFDSSGDDPFDVWIDGLNIE